MPFGIAYSSHIVWDDDNPSKAVQMKVKYSQTQVKDDRAPPKKTSTGCR
jgi:hypothetical protein